ncbi:hypothetical protein H8356DRAFT_1430578 [Neocallimastix lanati (nom. inval.)]|nr:hypothetical protein H8356DRAFT_1430578 [Neocallimastix sp. JGI-2020a]
MSKSYEENTEVFFQELNNECHEYVVYINQSPDIIDDLGCINIFEFYTIIIINKYLIDELLKEKDYDLLFCLISFGTRSFSYMSFEIFKYFYLNVHNHLLDNYIDLNANSLVTNRNIIEYDCKIWKG